MQFMYLYISFVLISFVFVPAWSQQASIDLKKINAFYEQTSVTGHSISYKSYANYTDKNPYEVLTGEIIRNKDNVYNKIGPVEIITTPAYTFSIDHEEKTMVLLPKSTSGVQMPIETDYVSLLSICSAIKYTSISSNSASYTLVFPSEEYEKITITFHPTYFCIQKLELYYKMVETYSENDKTLTTKPKMEIVYSEIKKMPEVTDAFFTYDTFLIKQSTNRYICKEPYSGYQFINQIGIKQ